MFRFSIEKIESGLYAGHLTDASVLVAELEPASSIESLLRELGQSFDYDTMPVVDISYRSVSIGTVTLFELRLSHSDLADKLVSRFAAVSEILKNLPAR
jgi:CRP-like cAMP-binding protein